MGLAHFPSSYLCGEQMHDPNALLVRSADLHRTVIPPSVLAVARAGAGVNNIPVAQCSASGVVVFNTPGANANAVKELTLAGMLLSARKIPAAMAWVQAQNGTDEDIAAQAERIKAQFAGPELTGKRLGVIGLGAIGVQVANAAHALGMEVWGYDPYLSVTAAWQLCRGVIRADTLAELLPRCDYLTLHLPLTAGTAGLIDADALSAMKGGVRLLNLARRELVRTPDLLDALDRGKVAAYVTDFAEAALLGRPDVIIFPHLGASTPEAEENCAVMAAEQLVDFLENGNIRNSVNLAPVVLPRADCPRLCVFHRNIPGMIAQISGYCSAQGLNIGHMQSASKGEYAYTLLDFTGAAQDDFAGLSDVPGIIRIRVLK